MRKGLLFFITLLLLSPRIYKVYSWDSEAAKFFPLAVGNQWSYHFFNRGGNPIPCYPNTPYDYIITITNDTLINGHKYYKFSNGDRLRIDSTSMNVYKYFGAGECLVDSLLARKNSTISSCEFSGIVTDTSMVMFGGENRRSINIFAPGYSKRLLHGIGLYFHGGCELGTGFEKQLNGCVINGIRYGVMLGLTNISNELADQFSLSQNYPNPFNPATNIKFQIPKSGLVKLTIFDALGKEVQTLVNQQLSHGTYSADFDGSNLPSGVYYYRIEAGSFTETKKMVLLK